MADVVEAGESEVEGTNMLPRKPSVGRLALALSINLALMDENDFKETNVTDLSCKAGDESEGEVKEGEGETRPRTDLAREAGVTEEAGRGREEGVSMDWVTEILFFAILVRSSALNAAASLDKAPPVETTVTSVDSLMRFENSAHMAEGEKVRTAVDRAV